MMILLALALLLTGCSASNLAEVMKALAADENAWCLKGQIGTVYGTESNFIGRGSSKASVEVTPDKCVITGSEVKPGSGTIQVPVTVPPHQMNLTPSK
jgi:hypothetical protein